MGKDLIDGVRMGCPRTRRVMEAKEQKIAMRLKG